MEFKYFILGLIAIAVVVLIGIVFFKSNEGENEPDIEEYLRALNQGVKTRVAIAEKVQKNTGKTYEFAHMTDDFNQLWQDGYIEPPGTMPMGRDGTRVETYTLTPFGLEKTSWIRNNGAKPTASLGRLRKRILANRKK